MDDEEIEATKAALAKDTERYRRAKKALDDVGKSAMAKALALLRANVAPTEVERLSPFTDSHIRKAARAAGIPPARPPRGITAPRD